jgi:hypothetical protein
VFENRVLRRIFERRTDEVTGEWRKLHNGELKIYVLFAEHYSGDKIQMGGACSTHGGEKRCIQGLDGET